LSACACVCLHVCWRQPRQALDFISGTFHEEEVARGEQEKERFDRAVIMSFHERIMAVPAASRGSSTSKKKKEKKKKKDLRQSSSSTTSTARSSVIIHETGGDDDELAEDFAKEYSLDLDQLGPSSASSPRPLSESSSDSKTESEDEGRGEQIRRKKGRESKPFTRPRVLTSSAEAISAPIISEGEGSSGDLSVLYNRLLTNNGGRSGVMVRSNGSVQSSLSSTRTNAQPPPPPPLAALSKELYLRVRHRSPPLFIFIFTFYFYFYQFYDFCTKA
jgi:hypothetical protein